MRHNDVSAFRMYQTAPTIWTVLLRSNIQPTHNADITKCMRAWQRVGYLDRAVLAHVTYGFAAYRTGVYIPAAANASFRPRQEVPHYDLQYHFCTMPKIFSKKH